MNEENFKPVRPKDRFLVFGAPAIEDEEIQEVVASMKGGWLGTGPKVARFERDIMSMQSSMLEEHRSSWMSIR